MKKLLAVVFAAVFALLFVGCDNREELLSIIESEHSVERENSLREESISREAEIEEVDEWCVSLDDVDRLAKAAIRKHENVWDYKQDYRKAIKVTDDILAEIEKNPQDHHDIRNFIEKYKESCDTGIEYLKSCVDVEFSYNLYSRDGELNKTEKDSIRRSLSIFNNSIKAVEQSKSDMDSLLAPIVEEDRTLTSDELEKVYEIYQVLTDKVYSSSIYY